MFIGLLGKMIEPTGPDVGLQLLVPRLGNKLLKPSCERSKFDGRKLGHR